MKIISGNIRQNLPPEVALGDINQAVEMHNPDVLCLQEATTNEVSDATTGYLGNIAIEHGMEPTFAQNRHFRRISGDIHSGIATLVNSKVAPVYKTREIELNSQRIKNPARPIGRRALLITTFEDGGRPLHIVNAHLSYPKLNPRARRREWRKVFETIDSLDGDVVITGDFNVRPGSQFIKECNRRWMQISDQKLPTWQGIYDFMPKRIKKRAKRTLDYVFTNKSCERTVVSEQLPQMHSDHIWHAITIETR